MYYKKLFKHKQTEKDYGHVIKSAVVSAIITLVIAIAIAYFVLPAATIRSGVTVIYAVIMSGVFVALFSFIHWINEDTYSGDEIRAKVKLFWLIIPAIALIMAASSLTCFHATKANSVAEVTVSEASIGDSFPDLAKTRNYEGLALIDLDSAKMLGDKKIAALEHASWYEVDHDEWNLIQHDGEYYRLAFLDYGGFWKHHKAHVDGIPGYILVECTPDGGVVTQNATLVELEEPIRYSEGAYWSHDLERHLRGQYPSYIFDKSFAEIDNDGKPFYVTGILRPQSGVWGIKTIESFILTNAQTGESTEYTIDNAPAWIDHVFSLDYLTRIAEWHYAYRDGFLNSLFSKTNVWHTSYHYRNDRSDKEDGEFANFYGYSSVALDGDVQFYTGLTAANNADSNLGWLFMDTSTGQMTEYSVIGAEESSAQKAVEQLVSAYRYQATFPLPANIAGEASYVMCLKGNAGLVQAYAICNVENYSIAVQAETLPAAIDLYLAKLGKENLSTSTPDKPTETEMQNSTSGPLDFTDIVNITSVEINGTTQYYYETTDGNVYVVVQIK